MTQQRWVTLTGLLTCVWICAVIGAAAVALIRGSGWAFAVVAMGLLNGAEQAARSKAAGVGSE